MLQTLQRVKRFLVGKPLTSAEMHHELLPKWKALAVLSSDALSSVAYATEEILLVLIGFGAMATSWSIPIAGAIVVLLFLLTLSYRQTIDSYPNGGGAYIVAKENLGQTAGLVAGASLLIDYVLTVSVSVASGIENLASATPMLQNHMVLAGCLVVLVLMILSLRGVSESATFLAVPTYAFLFSLLSLIGVGLYRAIFQGPMVVEFAPSHSNTLPELGLLVVLRAFASGCSALTGVEAISNGIPLFKEPSQKNAKTTLTWMTVLLGVLFAGVTFLIHSLHLTPNPDQTLISQLTSTIFGKSFFYYFTQAATAMILFLAAGTSYADFPRLASLLANDRFVPRQLAAQGDRLVFSNGIIGLSFAAALMLFLFDGRTHHLIPLYAVGVFTSFTLSQGGMVAHHFKLREPHWKQSLILNLLGAITTLVVLAVIIYSKFAQGAWMVILMIPVIVYAFTRIHAHYVEFGKELGGLVTNADMMNPHFKNRVLIPISGVHRGVVHAIRYAKTLSSNVEICMVNTNPQATETIQSRLREYAPDLKFTILPSPFRSVMAPLISYIDEIQKEHPKDYLTLLVPEFVTAKWYHQFLHNQTAFFLKTALIGKRRVVVSTIRYYLEST
jgi:amino acid transporter